MDFEGQVLWTQWLSDWLMFIVVRTLDTCLLFERFIIFYNCNAHSATEVGEHNQIFKSSKQYWILGVVIVLVGNMMVLTPSIVKT